MLAFSWSPSWAQFPSLLGGVCQGTTRAAEDCGVFAVGAQIHQRLRDARRHEPLDARVAVVVVLCQPADGGVEPWCCCNNQITTAEIDNA